MTYISQQAIKIVGACNFEECFALNQSFSTLLKQKLSTYIYN
jgi:hypothetical protein